MIRAYYFEFPNILDFEEVYAIVDEERQRLHISAVRYEYSTTFDLNRDFDEQIEWQTKWGDVHFNERTRQVVRAVIKELKLN